MKWYLKYLPYILLERKLKKADDFNAPTVKYINRKEIHMVLIDIEKGVWIGQNKKEFLLRRKERLEREIEDINKDLEGLNELS